MDVCYNDAEGAKDEKTWETAREILLNYLYKQ